MVPAATSCLSQESPAKMQQVNLPGMDVRSRQTNPGQHVPSWQSVSSSLMHAAPPTHFPASLQVLPLGQVPHV